MRLFPFHHCSLASELDLPDSNITCNRNDCNCLHPTATLVRTRILAKYQGPAHICNLHHRFANKRKTRRTHTVVCVCFKGCFGNRGWPHFFGRSIFKKSDILTRSLCLRCLMTFPSWTNSFLLYAISSPKSTFILTA